MEMKITKEEHSSKENVTRLTRLLIQNLIIICMKVKKKKFSITIINETIIISERNNNYLVSNMLEYKRLINHLSCMYRYPLKYFPYIFSEVTISKIQEEISNNEQITYCISDSRPEILNNDSDISIYKKIR